MLRLLARSVLSGLVVGSGLMVSCVDTSEGTPDAGPSDGGSAAVLDQPDALPGPVACVDTPPSVGEASAEGGGAPAAYTWKNVTILGGGFVTGIIFSPLQSGLIYARTDVGGAYRWDAASSQWTPITDWVGRNQSNLEGIESIAADPVQPSLVYMAAGEYLTGGSGVILSSSDTGNTWTSNAIPVPMGGNVNGRSVGERLAIDPNLPSTLYFGSRSSGLWKSTDSAATWNKVSAFPANGDATYGLTFVFFDRRSGSPGAPTSTIYVGVSTATSGGASLYRSSDGGSTWLAVASPPGQEATLYPHHAAMDYPSGTLYLPYNSGPGPNGIASGAVWKLDTSAGGWTNVSPPTPKGGYGGVAVDPANSGTAFVSSIDRWPDEIYRTTDGGATWTALGPMAVRDVSGAQWLYWGSPLPSATGWMGDVAIDPFDSTRALYITGQGLWWSDDVNAADTGLATHWAFRDTGIEQTVALGLISPSSGANLLSAVGDICGFRHDDLNASPAGGMFTNPIFGNTTALDFAERHPSLVVRVGTNSSSATTSGRGAYSTDGGTTWTPFVTEPSGTASAGSIAVSADGVTFLWAPQTATGGAGTVTAAYSRDWGATWTATTGLPGNAEVAADRVDPDRFYARGSGAPFYVSTDGGATFAASAAVLPLGGLPRPVFGHQGDLWIATSSGLYRSTDGGATFTQITTVTSAFAVGFGRGAACTDYPVLYLAGAAGDGTTSSGTAGVFRSDDQGSSWQRIDDPDHQFGTISYVTGDPRVYGRAYLGSGGRGVFYGDPQ